MWWDVERSEQDNIEQESEPTLAFQPTLPQPLVVAPMHIVQVTATIRGAARAAVAGAMGVFVCVTK